MGEKRSIPFSENSEDGIEKTIGKFIVAYLNDICIFSESGDANITHTDWIVLRLAAMGLKINVKKCEFLKEEIKFLGFMIEKGKMRISEEHQNSAQKFKGPTNRKELQSFLGVVGYMRNLIPNFSIKLHALYELLKKNKKFAFWSEERVAFDTIKKDIIKFQRSCLPDLKMPFIIYNHSPSVGMGAALTQEENDGYITVLQRASKRFLPKELNYFTTEKE